MKKGNKKGFTLIELIVVLAILAIIAAIAVPSAFGAIDTARQQADAATISSVNSAIRTHAGLSLVDGKVPTTLTVKTCLTDTGTTTTIKLQSASTTVFWIDGTNDAPGYYTTDAGITTGQHNARKTDDLLETKFKVTGTN